MLLSLMEKGASIIVLLAEGFDGVFIRSVLEQVPHKKATEACAQTLWTVKQYVGCFATYQILSGWEMYKYYYETVELPNPKANPTQEK